MVSYLLGLYPINMTLLFLFVRAKSLSGMIFEIIEKGRFPFGALKRINYLEKLSVALLTNQRNIGL